MAVSARLAQRISQSPWSCNFKVLHFMESWSHSKKSNLQVAYSTSSMVVCVYVWYASTCVYVSVCIFRCMDVEVREDVGYLPLSFSDLFSWNRVSHWIWSSLILIKLADQQAQWSQPLLLLSSHAGDTGAQGQLGQLSLLECGGYKLTSWAFMPTKLSPGTQRFL